MALCSFCTVELKLNGENEYWRGGPHPAAEADRRVAAERGVLGGGANGTGAVAIADA
jgi:hypothetical protein